MPSMKLRTMPKMKFKSKATAKEARHEIKKELKKETKEPKLAKGGMVCKKGKKG